MLLLLSVCCYFYLLHVIYNAETVPTFLIILSVLKTTAYELVKNQYREVTLLGNIFTLSR